MTRENILRKETVWEETGVTSSVKQRPENRAVRRYGHTMERENVPRPPPKKNVAPLNGRRRKKLDEVNIKIIGQHRR